MALKQFLFLIKEFSSMFLVKYLWHFEAYFLYQILLVNDRIKKIVIFQVHLTY